jgi:hypothetical protein
MNWDRGLKRITLTLSVIGAFIGAIVFSDTFAQDTNGVQLLLGMIFGAFVGFGVVWGGLAVICAVLMWNISGFRKDKKKDGQKTNESGSVGDC